LKGLIQKWATGNKIRNFSWHFSSSSHSSEAHQKQFNAAYYNRRGLFQLSRRNPEQALAYMREASSQDSSSSEIRSNYAMALLAVRRILKDPTLEEYLRNDSRPNPAILNYHQDEYSEFRKEYVLMLGTTADVEGLEAQLRRIQGATQEWSYSMAIGDQGSSSHELGSYVEDDKSYDPTLGLAEMPGSPVDVKMYSHELEPNDGQSIVSESIVSVSTAGQQKSKMKFWK
jgi:hypothetical protein